MSITLTYRKVNDDTFISCKEYPFVEFDIPSFEEGETEKVLAEMELDTIEKLIGFALHSRQQWQSYF